VIKKKKKKTNAGMACGELGFCFGLESRPWFPFFDVSDEPLQGSLELIVYT